MIVKRKIGKWLYKIAIKHGIYLQTFNFEQLAKNRTRFLRLLFYFKIVKVKCWYKKLRKLNGSVGAMKVIQNQIDNINNANLNTFKPAVKCKKGCANCCYIPVIITDDEAISLIDYCNKNNIEIAKNKAHFQAIGKQSLNLSKELRSCIFLDTISKSCLVYPVRPLVCRGHFSLTDPKHCEWINMDDPAKKQYVILKSEMLIMGVINCNIIGNLPAMVLKQLM